MAIPTHWCAVIIMLSLIQGLLGARQCAHCGTYMLADIPVGTTVGKALLTLFFRRTRPNGPRGTRPDLNPDLLGPKAHVLYLKLYDLCKVTSTMRLLQQ